MRYFGTLEVPQVPVLPDTTLNLLLTAATGQAFDYPTGTDLLRISNGSTFAAGAVVFNPSSTSAAVASTAGVISSSVAGQNILIPAGESRLYQRPRSSTGFSVIAPSSHAMSVEFWSRAGTT